jgi:hypothetical protein
MTTHAELTDAATLEAELTQLFQEWEKERQRAAAKVRKVRYLSAFCLGLGFCILAHSLALLADARWERGVITTSGAILTIIHSAIGLAARIEIPSKRVEAIAARIRGYEDIRVIPSALQIYHFYHGTNAATTEYLTRALPNLTANHALMMKPYLSLIAAIVAAPKANVTWDDVLRRKLAVAALEALKQVGDASILPTIEKVAVRKPKNSEDRKVIEAAQECLPYLQLRATATTQQETLLRASPSETENLVRPVHEMTIEATPQELLRVADGLPRS